MTARRLGRRQFLIATGATGLAVAAGCSSSDGSRSTPVTIGPTDPAVAAAEAARPTTGTVVRRELRAAPATLDLGRQRVETWAYDGAVPGAELRAVVGDTLEVVVRNDLPEDTTVHWHGLALRNDMDGVHDLTQGPIRPGDTFTYRCRPSQKIRVAASISTPGTPKAIFAPYPRSRIGINSVAKNEPKLMVQ